MATTSDISADGKIDRTKETEFKIDTTLLRAVLVPSTNYQLLNFPAIDWFMRFGFFVIGQIARDLRIRIYHVILARAEVACLFLLSVSVYSEVSQSEPPDWLIFDDVFSELLVLF